MNSKVERGISRIHAIMSPRTFGHVVSRYGFALLAVAGALGAGLLAGQYHVPDVQFALFLFAFALITWYAGPGPGIVAFVLGSLAFNYFFTPPLYSFALTPEDLAYYLVFLLFGALLVWFSAVRRRVEQNLRDSRDQLAKEVEERRVLNVELEHSRDRLAKEVEQRRVLNVELEKRSDELQAINQELEAFAYSVSHDLRAPVRHMAGFAELLQKHAGGVLDEKGRRHLGMILESAQRMGQLIDDLLAFSRIGRAETHKTLVSLEQLVQEAVSEVAPETQGRELVWRVGALPLCYGDRSMLRLVLVNLLSNAVKFTRTRPQPEIEIGLTGYDPDQVVVFVRDNGVGFNMKYLNKLFGVFQRLHPQEAFEGTGIGLATVQRIVHRHGGRVWAEGAVDQGATFYFSLPKSKERGL
jgi:signal transduction histidine kinase